MISSVILRICDFIFVLRPLILIPAWSFYLIGASVGGRQSPGSFPDLAAFSSLTAILVTAYLLNQIFDRESDAINNKCLFLAHGIFDVKTMVILAAASFVVASTNFHRTESYQHLPLIFALLLSLFYSLPPIRLCARPLFDMLANAVGYGGVAFVLGYNIFTGGDGALAASIPYVCLVASTFLHTAILDIRGDAETQKISTAVLLGERRTGLFAALLSAAALVTAIINGSATAIIVTVLSFAIATMAVMKPSHQSSAAVVKLNTAIVTLVAVFFWPTYLILLVPLVLLSRFYHRKRFGIIYPGLRTSA